MPLPRRSEGTLSRGIEGARGFLTILTRAHPCIAWGGVPWVPEAGCKENPDIPQGSQTGRPDAIALGNRVEPSPRPGPLQPPFRVAERADPRCRCGMICFPSGHRPKHHKGPTAEDDHHSSVMIARAAGPAAGSAGRGDLSARSDGIPRGHPLHRGWGRDPLVRPPTPPPGRTPGGDVVRSVSRHQRTMPPTARGGGARTSGSDADRRATPPFNSSGCGRGVRRRSANRPMTASRRLVGRRSIRIN